MMMWKKELNQTWNFGMEDFSNLLLKIMTCNNCLILSYGPFWIHTTIVFCLGAVHNILQYQGNPDYDYDY